MPAGELSGGLYPVERARQRAQQYGQLRHLAEDTGGGAPLASQIGP